MSHKEYKSFLEFEIGKGIKSFLKSRFEASKNSVYMIRKAQYLYSKGSIGKLLSKMYIEKLKKKYGIFILPDKKIGKGLRLPHPNGIIFGVNSIGENCTIYQQVTMGSSHVGDYKKKLQPVIGDNVVIFSGAKLIGDINVASGTIIGANAVLTKSTEENTTYVGIPAKKIVKNMEN